MILSLASRQPTRLADEVAADLRRQILGSQLREGDRLPTEKELCEHYGVSRSVVREAVAQLKTEALVRARQGAGVYVAEARSALFRLSGDQDGARRLRNLYELRCGVEVAAAGLAATRHTPADIDRLEAAIARMSNPATRAAADIDFHVAVAAATRNELYENFVSFLGNALSSAIEGAVENTIVRHPSDQARVIAEHARILDAVAARHPHEAEAAMLAHVQAAMARLALPDDLPKTIKPRR